ncbi:MAG: response regulator [bacterium]|nr:response regulator [bacterium]
MPGESILFVDDSLAIQDIAQRTLRSAGYNVITASNGAAALTYPEIEDVDLIVMDSDMAGLSGDETNRLLKQHAHTHPIPVLALIPEEQISERESIYLTGAAAYLLKPFDAASLTRKVAQILEQQQLDDMARQYLADTADRLMKDLAEGQISQAVERKTQIIVERCIQNITTLVDQRARGEVEQKVTALVAEKEQDLVKMTVREVAQSMVEKLAERKVEEAMTTILNEQTERVVRRASDQIVPNLIRERVKEMLANILPREVDTKLQKAAEKMVAEISGQIVGTVETVANKTIPRLSRDLLPSSIETQARIAIDQMLPVRVQELVARELIAQMNENIEPVIRRATARIQRSALVMIGILGVPALIFLGLIAYSIFFPGR